MAKSTALSDLILCAHPDIEAIAAFLDGKAPNVRIEETRALGVPEQKALWRLAAGRAMTFDDLVPPDYGPLEPVRHYGKNTLPAFTHFEKRFCRPSPGAAGGERLLWGYNEGASRPLIGPGYFVVRETPTDPRGATVVDYFRVPPEKPEGWPKILPNEHGLQRLVYAHMHDFLRRVSTHVSIGRAWREHRETPNHFLLCREG
jgi:hypothetical protein